MNTPRRGGLPAAMLAVMACALLACALLPGALFPAEAAASTTELQILEADGSLYTNPVATMAQIREEGFNTLRVMAFWQTIAPDPDAFTKPRHFDAADPTDYPAAKWAPFDGVVTAAAQDGITIDMDVMGGAPLWATGPGMPKQTSGYPFHDWRPNPSAYGAFVKAVATRYSGDFDPVTGRLDPGNANDLPRVSFWSLWNEPNYGPSLSPQAVPGSDSVPESPWRFRALLDHGWSALRAAGHRTSPYSAYAATKGDTIIWGELDPRGTPTFGTFNGMTPLAFLRAVYCVGPTYEPLTGAAAAQIHCPPTRAARRRFAADNPALFQASGVSDHPYMRWFPPDVERNTVPRVGDFSQLVSQYTSLARIGQLESALNRLLAAYRVHVKLPIYDTEFGYMTDPPKRHWRGDSDYYPSLQTAAEYDNWAEYISYNNPRIASFDQYLLQDDVPVSRLTNYGGYASGLSFYDGTDKPGYAAFRMPLYLPHTTAASSSVRLLVWGAVKPAAFALLDLPSVDEQAQLMFRPTGSRRYEQLGTVTLTNGAGYFETHLAFPSSGTLIARWTVPQDQLLADAGQTLQSRTVQVTVK